MAHVMKVCEYSLRAVADCCFSREEIKQKYPILLYLRTLKLSVQLLREPCHFVCCLVSSQPSEMATINTRTEVHGGDIVAFNITGIVFH